MKKIVKDKLPSLWEQLSSQATLFLPVEQDGVVNFAPWEEGDSVNLEALNTVVPPKNVVFPQTETYMRFKVENDKLHIEPFEQNGPYVLFGARPCDVAGITLLDKVFLQEPEDGLYSRRRREGTVISVACNEPDAACFCTSFELEPGMAPGADIMVWDMGDYLLWKAQSEKGEKLTGSVENLLQEAAEEEQKAAMELKERVTAKEAAAAQEMGWDPSGVKETLKDMFDSDIWEQFFRRCLGCGICTYICPTCHCFDIQDYSKDQEGGRFRCWDSCMFADFTLMGSGENPRPTRKERVRQRFMHKLCYYPSNFGLYACVGCGRCVRKCPVNLDIAQVIKEVGGVKSGSE